MNLSSNILALITKAAVVSGIPVGPDTQTIQPKCTGTVELVKRVTNRDNAQGCSVCDGIRRHNWAVWHKCDILGPYVPPTEKWEITDLVAVERFTVVRELLGTWATNEFVAERVLLSVTNHQVLNTQWIQAPPATNTINLTATGSIDFISNGFTNIVFAAPLTLSLTNTNLTYRLVKTNSLIARDTVIFDVGETNKSELLMPKTNAALLIDSLDVRRLTLKPVTNTTEPVSATVTNSTLTPLSDLPVK